MGVGQKGKRRGSRFAGNAVKPPASVPYLKKKKTSQKEKGRRVN